MTARGVVANVVTKRERIADASIAAPARTCFPAARSSDAGVWVIGLCDPPGGGTRGTMTLLLRTGVGKGRNG
jgi:hypothetical protein